MLRLLQHHVVGWYINTLRSPRGNAIDGRPLLFLLDAVYLLKHLVRYLNRVDVLIDLDLV